MQTKSASRRTEFIPFFALSRRIKFYPSPTQFMVTGVLTGDVVQFHTTHSGKRNEFRSTCGINSVRSLFRFAQSHANRGEVIFERLCSTDFFDGAVFFKQQLGASEFSVVLEAH